LQKNHTLENKENVYLVPTDFTDQTVIALEQTYNLAKFSNASILILLVINKIDSVAEIKLERMAQKARKESGVPVETMVRIGKNPYKEIENVAKERNVKMIVLGLESKITIDKIVGQNAFKLVREAEGPVLTIKGKKHRKGCENIVLPLDLTKETREKVTKAIEFAKYFGAAIRVVSVLASKKEEKENKLMAYSAQVRKYIKDEGLKASIKTLRGKDIANLVVNYANAIDADLIMIMSKAELNMKEFFMGTTAQRIINISNVPVLSIRPMKRKDMTGSVLAN